MLKSVSTLLLSSFLSSHAFAAFNFNGSIVAPPVVSTQPNGYKEIKFQIMVNNTGDTDYTGPFTIKPFLLANDFKTTVSLLQKGAVLDTLKSTALTIPAGGSVTLDYSGTLPLLRSAGYHLSAFINNEQTILETSTDENVTDLVPAGQIQVTAAPSSAGVLDMYTEYNGNLNPTRGGIVDSLRTIVQGSNLSFPSRSLWARFMLADMTTKKVYTAPYVNYGTSTHTTCVNRPNTDKNWFAIAYSSELDPSGSAVSVDYYNQAPCFEDVAPGDYAFLTLLNTRDLVAESNIHNNLNARAITILPAKRNTRMQEIWFVQTNNEATLSQTLKFTASYMKSLAWNMTLPSITGLSTNLKSGIIGGSGGAVAFGQEATLTLATADLVGHQSGEAEMSFDVFSGFKQTFPIKFFQYAPGAAPVLSLPIAENNIYLGRMPAIYHGNIVIANTGVSPMSWSAAAEDSYVSLPQSSGVVAPQSKIVIPVKVDSNMIAYNYTRQTMIKLLTSTVDTNHDIKVSLVWQ